MGEGEASKHFLNRVAHVHKMRFALFCSFSIFVRFTFVHPVWFREVKADYFCLFHLSLALFCFCVCLMVLFCLVLVYFWF